MEYTDFHVSIALRTLLFGRLFEKNRRSRCSSCRRSIPAILAQVLKEGFLVLVVLELPDRLLDLLFASCILLFNCRKW